MHVIFSLHDFTLYQYTRISASLRNLSKLKIKIQKPVCQPCLPAGLPGCRAACLAVWLPSPSNLLHG